MTNFLSEELQEFNKIHAEFQAKLEAARKAASQSFSAIIYDAFLKLKEQVPQLKAITWTQYTPYFNDGESCVFTVNDICFHWTDDLEDESKHKCFSGDLSSWLVGYRASELNWDKSKTYQEWAMESFPERILLEDAIRINNILVEFSQQISSVDDDIFYYAFGDHSKVIVKKSGVHVEEYEHD